jgi:xanthosine utilization system XapX-like protein
MTPRQERMKDTARRQVGALLSLAAGVAVALVLHYVLYRIGIPGTPFIYVVF